MHITYNDIVVHAYVYQLSTNYLPHPPILPTHLPTLSTNANIVIICLFDSICTLDLTFSEILVIVSINMHMKRGNMFSFSNYAIMHRNLEILDGRHMLFIM